MNSRLNLILICVLGILMLTIHYYLKEDFDREIADSFTDSIKRARHLQNKPAKEFELTFVDGRQYKLSEDLGKRVVIVNFFATWCAPCKKEVPELVKFYSDLRKEVELIGVSIGEDKETVDEFIERYGINYPIALVKSKSQIVKDYDISSYPTTVVIGIDQKIDLYETGAIYNAQIVLDQVINKNMKILKNRDKKKLNPDKQ